MKITIMTLFPENYHTFINTSIIKRAIAKQLVEIEVVDFREFSDDKHKKVDDYQFGGGPGMVLALQPIVTALKHHKTPGCTTILTSPSGKLLNQAVLEHWKTLDHVILIAGHYEGFDARIEHYVDETISIGDYVLTGGELPTLVMLDALVRLIPDVINESSLECESFNDNLLDYPVYTKPLNYENHEVPSVLLSGNHKVIAEYRKQAQIDLTKAKRPDLYKKYLKKGNKNDNN